MKKKLLIALSYVLILAVGIVGTLAYLTDKDEVKNTFVLSENIDISMDESEVEKVKDDYIADNTSRVKENTYEAVYPGAELPKDPTIHVLPGEDVYVRAIVTIPNGTEWLGELDADYAKALEILTAGTIGADWSIEKTETDGTSVIYTMLYANRLNENEDAAPVFEKIVVPNTFTYAEIELMADANNEFHVNVIAQAIQAAGFDTAAEAFAGYDATV